MTPIHCLVRKNKGFVTSFAKERIFGSRISFIAVLLFLNACCFGTVTSASESQLDYNQDEVTELTDLVTTYLAQDLDSAQLYLKLLKIQSADSPSHGNYLRLSYVYHYYRSNLDSAIYYSNLYYQYGIDNDDVHIEADGLTRLMLFYEFLGELEKSELNMNLLKEVMPRVTDRDRLAKIYSALGARAMNANEYSTSLMYYLKIDSIYAAAGTENRSRAMALENIGSLYGNLKDTLTFDYYNRAREMYARIDDVEGMNYISLELGKHYLRLEIDRSALIEFLSCKDFFENYKKTEPLLDIYQGLMSAYMNTDQIMEAEHYHERLKKVIEGVQIHSDKSLYNFLSGELYYHKKQYDKSISHYKEGLRFFSGDATIKYQGLKGITKTFEALKDYKNAYLYSELKFALNDSLNKARNYQTMQTLETEYQTKQKQEEIELLSAQNEVIEQKRKALSISYISILSVVTLLASFLYFLYRNRKKVAFQLDQVDKMKSKFFTNISHEFRTPLTIIGGLSNQILKSPQLDSVHIKPLQSIQGNVDRLEELTNQLIDLNKIDAQKLEVNYVSGDIHAYLNKYALLFSSYITSQQKELILTLPEEALIMDFDEEKIQSVLYNLLQNAIKHSKDHGIIEMRASRVGDYFCLQIIDNGKGIDKDNIDQIFDRFYSTSEQGAIGSGVGLAYVKELITLCKGEITVTSHLNEGSTFKILLPIENQATTKSTLEIELPVKIRNQSADAAQEVIIPYGDMHMLIVEDNDDISKYLKMLLQDEFLVTTAVNGKEAISIIENETIDFILSDVMMPEMDGFEFCKYVKRHSDHSHIPFILITAKTSTKDKRKGHELGVDGYLTKPFDEAELLALISKLLKKRNDKMNWFAEVLELKSSNKEEELVRQEDLDFIKNIQALILENPISYGVSELSHTIGMSSKAIRNKIKALTGKPINKYSNHIRMEKSKELLSNTDYTISQVANQVGYQDAAYYSRVFKKYNNISPKLYKEQVSHSMK